MTCTNAMSSDEEVKSVIASPSTSHWLRQALELALTRDRVDAANDAELLSEILARRCGALRNERLPEEDS